MLYLTGSVSPEVWPLVQAGDLGILMTPRSRYAYQGGPWAADNGCFSASTYVGDDQWFAWLERRSVDAASCLFAVAPDVLGDAAATLERSLPWLGKIRALGYPAALVAQDGLEDLTVPWDDFDWLFIGGSTDWKLSRHARALAGEAKRRGKRVHMGRVNSERRLRFAKFIGCDTADGTHLQYAPTSGLADVRSWLRGVNDQMEMT